MKRLTLVVVLLLSLGAMFYVSSCKKDPVYSCDEKLNEYAVQTISEHQSISRDELATMGLDTQFAVYNSLSPSNKARIAREKLSLLLGSDSFTNEEKQHLQLAYDFINTEIYEEDAPNIDSFVNYWEDFAFNALNYDSAKVYWVSHTWLIPNDIPGIPDFAIDDPVFEGGNGGTCNCEWGYICAKAFLPCTKGACTATKWGCGWFFRSPCTGRCF